MDIGTGSAMLPLVTHPTGGSRNTDKTGVLLTATGFALLTLCVGVEERRVERSVGMRLPACDVRKDESTSLGRS
jgi:hypothetical protein